MSTRTHSRSAPAAVRRDRLFKLHPFFDDAAEFLERFQNGAIGIRMSAGHKNALGFEANVSAGSIRFDLERLNELRVYFAEDGPVSGIRTVMEALDAHHEYLGPWWPPGHVLGWSTDLYISTPISSKLSPVAARFRPLSKCIATSAACRA